MPRRAKLAGFYGSVPVIFCTLFNRTYLPHGIALYRSLEQSSPSDFLLYVLCMDQTTAEVLARLNLRSLKIIHLKDIETETMRAIRTRRSIAEYCWTCTTPLLLHIFEKCAPDTVVTYVDADVCFFSDPAALLDELGSGSIYVHEHDFVSRYSPLLPVVGRFNVGVACFRNDDEGRACLALWNSQCIEECMMDLDAGKCGDQNYLDDWPSLYSNMVISTNPGVGLGPWNVEKRNIQKRGDTVFAGGRPAIFYHYHSLRMLRPVWWFKSIWLSGWFEIPGEAVSAIYRPYARNLWGAVDDIEQNGCSLTDYLERLPSRAAAMPYPQVLLSIGKYFVPEPWSWRIFELFYRYPRGDEKKVDGALGPRVGASPD
jgi:hypothetical protein